jgi:hypothetical protein
MVRILLSFPGAFAAALAACTPSPQETVMESPSPSPETAAGGSNGAGTKRDSADSPAEAEGRRILSTAFVRVGPDGRLAVELRDGRMLVLRDVVLRRGDYCGTQLLGGAPGTQYCGSYADVAAARPGSAPADE